MGVSSLVNRVPYNGDGSTTTFSFPYYFFAQTDINVYRYDTILGGVTTPLLNTDFTISGTQNSQGLYPNGANIIFSVAPLNTDIVVIVRVPPEKQNYALLQNGNISSTALVQQLDYLTLLVQRLEDQISRCPVLPDGMGETFSNQLPSTTALNPLQYLIVNSSGNGWALTPSLSPIQELIIGYLALQTASTSNQYHLFDLPAGSILTYLVIKHTAAFAGTSITDVKASLGNSGTAALFINGFDLYQAPGDTIYDSVVANYIGSFVNPTGIYMTVTSTGANLANLTAGSVNVWYDFDTL